MLARTLTLAACVLTTTSAAQAQQLLNPLSWFNSSPAYSTPAYSQGNYGSGVNCANGNCAPQQAYRNYPAANCPAGNCGPNGAAYGGYPTANCPNGFCGTPNTGYTNYRPLAPQPVVTQPRYNTAPVFNASYDNRYQTPVARPQYPVNQYPVNQYLGNQYPRNSAAAPRQLNTNNSPFYP